MPVELNTFFQQAAAVGDNASLRVDAETRQVETGSGLHGVRKLSVSAHKAENRAAVREFMNALSRDPRYAELAGQVREPLEALVRAGKPLTAGQVKQTQLTLEVARGMEIGRDLAAAGKLPAGHGSSFGQYAVVRNLPLDSPAQVAAALKDYLLTQVVARDTAALTLIEGMGEANEQAAAVLKKACGPLTGPNGFFAEALDRALEGGVEGFSFAALEHAFETDNADNLAVLRGLRPQDMGNLSQMPAANMLSAMREALPALGTEGMRSLFRYMASTMPRLDTPEARADCARHYLLHEAALPSARAVMEAHELPENFDSALGHNPEVVKHARALLDADPGRGVIPTPERAAEALSAAVEEFTVAHEPELREFLLMAQDPPADIKPPLTPETLPRYLNTMLAGDDVLEPLLNDSVPLDAAFMDKLSAHAEAMNSAAHSFRGDFGTDDVAGVLRNSVTLLLARRGVTPDMYPEIMGRTMDKFGKLSSELATLNLAVQRGYGRAAGLDFLGVGMTVFRSLEGHGRALLSLMSREQRAAVGAGSPLEPDPADAEALRADAELGADFLEKNFQNDGKLEEVSDNIRAFARAHGLPMPDMDPAVAARLEDEAQERLAAANQRECEAVLDEFVVNTGHVRETNTEAFLAALTEAGRHNDLAGIDPDAVSATALYERMQSAVFAVLRAANDAGTAVDPAAMRAAAAASLTQGFVELKATLDAIDGLPGRREGEPGINDDRVPVFTPAEKAWMKEAVQHTGLRDAAAIASLAAAARAPDFAGHLTGMAAPAANAKQLAETARAMASAFLTARQTVGNVAGSEDAMAFMMDMGMRFSGLTADQARDLAANLNTDTAQKVAGSFLLARQLPDLPVSRQQVCMAIPAILNEARMASEVLAAGNSDLDPMFFTTEVEHLSEVPSGTNGCMHELRTVVGNAVDGVANALSRRVPPLTREQWEQLTVVANDLQARATGNRNADLLAHWVADSAADLLAALAANRGRPLDDARIWDAMVGGDMPRGVGGPNFGANMLAEVERRYQGLILAAAPDIPGPVLQAALGTHSAMGVSPKKMLELARPGARLTLADIHGDMDMSSLRNYGPDTAYGLVTDFRRRGRDTEMTFTDRAGNGRFTQPFFITDADNKADHPEFQAIIRTVRGMTHSEGQTARVLQTFSQAPLIMPRVLSSFFPGVEFSEHGNFSVRATEQQDGSVLVDITSDPTLPLVMTEQFRIEPDGSHACTAFEMRRPALNQGR